MLEQKCTPRIIAGSDACEVWACKDCGTIHLNIGPVSMRLKQAHFVKAVETLAEAIAHLNSLQPDITLQKQLDREKLHH